MEKFFSNVKSLTVVLFLLIFPFFFLNITQEYFITNKFYLLGFGALFIILILALEIAITKKIHWETKKLDLPVILFIFSLFLSLLISSSNKIQAFLSPNFGLTIFLSLGIFYFYLSRNIKDIKKYEIMIIVSSLILSLITIVFYFQPFKNINLPVSLEFLKNPFFTPLGNQLDLVIFLGFFLIVNIFCLFTKKKFINSIFLIINLVAFSLTAYRILTNSLVLPPFSNSWFAGLEVMKNIKTAFFGVGIDNFSAVFTRVKDLSYNQSPLWQINSFSVARNLFLNVLVETGILGLISLIYLFLTAFKNIIYSKNSLALSLLAGLTIIVLIVPPSLPILFLLFITFSLVSDDKIAKITEIEISNFPLLYFGISLVLIIISLSSGYLLNRGYQGEIFFKKAVSAISKNNGKEAYNNLKKARISNPYEEKFILTFSQTNLLIAGNLAKKDAEKITDQDRQVIAQAIQTAISEAKILIKLNPNKSQYFQNLAEIYKNIIPLAKGSDAWTVSAYQRAIIFDPMNPSYRINLGGVYYLLGQYSDAISLFEQAVSLKPDWPNAYYNLAWGYYQNKKYDKATLSMQNVVNLINKEDNPKDWEKANKELEEFKNKLAIIQQEATSSSQLNLPEKPEIQLEPKLDLSPDASPEAKQTL